jgi:glycosyltransferase involved in cell wall biosynthesis
MITTPPPTSTSNQASDLQALRIAFVNPVNLFDAGNGAATSVRTMLEQLAKRGASCQVLTACCFDVPPDDLVGSLGGRGLASTGKIAEFDIPVWQGSVDGVSYDAVTLSTQSRVQLTAVEEMIFRDTARKWLEQYRPNIVITFGGLLLDVEIQRCAKAVGAAVVFYLANPHYARRETFDHVDLVLTNSAASAAHYAAALGLQCRSVGAFVDLAPIVTFRPEPKFITFINPLPEKGVALFLKLVQKAAQTAADMRFLVVESRGKLADAVRKLNLPEWVLDNVTVLPRQDNMAEVYAQTKVLLVPSFWFETAGRVLVEANANGIPVIAADRGGIVETLGDAGRVLPIPEQCMRDYWTMPSDAEIAPWWDELSKLWRASAYYQMQARKALAVSQTHGLDVKTDALAKLLLPLVGAR